MTAAEQEPGWRSWSGGPGWILLVLGVGGVSGFVAAVLEEGLPPGAGWYAWPLGAVLLTGVGAILLRRAARGRPRSPPRVALLELLTVPALCTLVLGLLPRGVLRDHYPQVALALLLGALLLLLALGEATRREVCGWGPRSVFVLGSVLFYLGLLALGTCVSIGPGAISSGEGVLQVLAGLLFVYHTPLTWAVRVGLLGLPAGAALRWVGLRAGRRLSATAAGREPPSSA
jgi:hypothetical protein